MSLRWENENWNLNGGDQTTPAGVVSWNNARRRPVDVGTMVYMPQMEGMWRFETAPPIEDRFFQGAYDCDVTTGAGIFVPDGSKMVLYWPASDEKRGGRTPIAVSMEGGAYVLEHGSVPAKALPPAWTNTAKAKGTTDASGSAAVSPQEQKPHRRQISDSKGKFDILHASGRRGLSRRWAQGGRLRQAPLPDKARSVEKRAFCRPPGTCA